MGPQLFSVVCESRPRQHLDGSGSVFRSRRRNRRCAVCFERCAGSCAGSEIRGMGSEKTWNDGIHSPKGENHTPDNDGFGTNADQN